MPPVTRSLWLAFGVGLLLAGPLAKAAPNGDRAPSQAYWKKTPDGLYLEVPLTTMLTDKQRDMIEGGFTTVSEFTVTKPATGDATTDQHMMWRRSCSVKFDAWEETYELHLLAASQGQTAETFVVRTFTAYGDRCLTARLVASDELLRVAASGKKLLGRLDVRQISVEEGARIKEWLVRQQSGLMQSLFKHMIGELALHQSLTVSITVPPLPRDMQPTERAADAPKTLERGP